MKRYHPYISYYSFLIYTFFVINTENGYTQIFNYLLGDDRIKYLAQTDSNHFMLFELDVMRNEIKRSLPTDSIEKVTSRKFFRLFGKVKFIFDEYGFFLVEKPNKFKDSFHINGCNVSELSAFPSLASPKHHYLIYHNNYILSNEVIFEMFYDNVFPITWNEWIGLRSDYNGRRYWFYITYRLAKNKRYLLECKEERFYINPSYLTDYHEIIHICPFSKQRNLILTKDIQLNKIHIYIISKTARGFKGQELSNFKISENSKEQTQVLFKKLEEGHLFVSYPTENTKGMKIEYFQISDSLKILTKGSFYNESMATFYPQSISKQDSLVSLIMYRTEMNGKQVIYYNFKLSKVPEFAIKKDSVTLKLPTQSNNVLHFMHDGRFCILHLRDSSFEFLPVEHGNLKDDSQE